MVSDILIVKSAVLFLFHFDNEIGSFLQMTCWPVKKKKKWNINLGGITSTDFSLKLASLLWYQTWNNTVFFVWLP